MGSKNKLDELHLQKLSHVNELIENIDKLPKEEKEKVQKAHEEWLSAWSKLQEALLFLEKLEI